MSIQKFVEYGFLGLGRKHEDSALKEVIHLLLSRRSISRRDFTVDVHGRRHGRPPTDATPSVAASADKILRNDKRISHAVYGVANVPQWTW